MQAGPRIVDDFGTVAKIAWRRDRLCGLCNYDGAVPTGKGVELSGMSSYQNGKRGGAAARPTTFATAVGSNSSEEDEEDYGGGGDDDGTVEVDLRTPRVAIASDSETESEEDDGGQEAYI